MKVSVICKFTAFTVAVVITGVLIYLDKDIATRANWLATSPEKPAKITRQKVLDPLTGKYIFGEEISTPKKKEKTDEKAKGGLK